MDRTRAFLTLIFGESNSPWRNNRNYYRLQWLEADHRAA
jgi:hypothetical protein